MTADVLWEVNGQWDLPTDGQQHCPLAARCSARGSVGQWRHPPSCGGGLGEADAVACGEHDVGAL